MTSIDTENPEAKKQREAKAFYGWLTEGLKTKRLKGGKEGYRKEEYAAKLAAFEAIIEAQTDEKVRFIGQAVVGNEVDEDVQKILQEMADKGWLGRAIVHGNKTQMSAGMSGETKIGDNCTLNNVKMLFGNNTIINSTLRDVELLDSTVTDSNLWNTKAQDSIFTNVEGSTCYSLYHMPITGGAISNSSLAMHHKTLIATPKLPLQ